MAVIRLGIMEQLPAFAKCVTAFAVLLWFAPTASAAEATSADRIYRTQPPSMAGTNCPDIPDDKLLGAVRDTLSRGGIVILGEIHDNFLHHMSRACIVDRIARVSDQQTPAAVFEQFSVDQQNKLDGAKASALADFKATVAWSTSGWSQYKYDPLFQAVLAAKLPLYAGDVTREMIMKTSREGAKALSETDQQKFGLDKPLGVKLDDASLNEIEGAHCGLMPKTAFGGMAFGQRYRDAHIADVALAAAAKHGGAIVFAGSTHARSDRGVAWYVKTRAPNVPVLSVAYVEAAEGEANEQAAFPVDPNGGLAADYVVVTLPIERPDPCIEMLEMMKGKKPR